MIKKFQIKQVEILHILFMLQLKKFHFSFSRFIANENFTVYSTHQSLPVKHSFILKNKHQIEFTKKNIQLVCSQRYPSNSLSHRH